MKVLELLLGSWIGLLSPFTVMFVIGMAAYLFILITKHMKEPGG